MNVIGVDLGIYKVATAHWADDLLMSTDAYSSPALVRQEQLLQVADHLYETVWHTPKVDLVIIEDTLIGNNRKYSIKLSQTMGACLLRLGELQQLKTFDVLLVNNKKWKKEVLLNGNATKDMIRNHVNAMNPSYAELCGGDQDRYDATCIAYYGSLLGE